jgi:hypothetical protein
MFGSITVSWPEQFTFDKVGRKHLSSYLKGMYHEIEINYKWYKATETN